MEDIAQAILRRWWVVLLAVLAFVGPTLGISLWRLSLSETPVYEASTRLQWVVDQPGTATYSIPVGPFLPGKPGPERLVRITPAVAKSVDSSAVAEAAIRRFDLRMPPDELLGKLSAEQAGETIAIRLSYRDTDPERAQRVVNAVGVVASERIPEEFGLPENITVMVWKRADLPDAPLNPKPKPLRNGLLALVVGLVVGIGVALLMERRAT